MQVRIKRQGNCREQPLLGGNPVTLEMVEKTTQRVNVKEKTWEMKCLIQIQSITLVSNNIFCLYAYMSQGCYGITVADIETTTTVVQLHQLHSQCVNVPQYSALMDV